MNGSTGSLTSMGSPFHAVRLCDFQPVVLTRIVALGRTQAQIVELKKSRFPPRLRYFVNWTSCSSRSEASGEESIRDRVHDVHGHVA
jgi:hypothetical protein